MQQPPLSLDYIRQVVAEYFADKPVSRVEIFGSYARGDATAESDLDVLLKTVPNGGVSLFSLAHYQNDLEQQLGIKVDLSTALSPFSRPYIESDLKVIYEQVA